MSSSIAADPSYRLLACRYLREQLETLMVELRGVRANETIEPVHQSRVASRRIRAALKMFADCFEPAKVALWRKQVKKLTRELGAARDKDVQIEFVEEFLAGLDKNHTKCRPGVERLLLRLWQGRAAMQPEAIEVLDGLERKNTLAQMYGQLGEILFTLRSQDVSVRSPHVYETAAAHIRARRDDFVARERVLDDPEDAPGHHQLRIAAKKLRYTLEICEPVYGEPMPDIIKAVKKVQSLLGDIHDCDVWGQDIDRFMEQERLATIGYYGHVRPFNRLKAGLLFIRENRFAHRRQVFAELLDYWKDLDVQSVWETLENMLESRVGATELPRSELQDGPTDAGKEQIEENRADR